MGFLIKDRPLHHTRRKARKSVRHVLFAGGALPPMRCRVKSPGAGNILVNAETVSINGNLYSDTGKVRLRALGM